MKGPSLAKRHWGMTGKGHPFIKNPAYGASKAGIVSLARYFPHWGRSGSPGQRSHPVVLARAKIPSSAQRGYTI